MLRAVPDKFMGFLVMAAAIAILFVLPWLDRSPVKSIRYKGKISRVAILLFAAAFITLGVLGVRGVTPGRTALSQVCTVLYFLYFLAMPIWTSFEKTLPEPERVTMNGGIGAWGSLGALLIVIALVVIPLKAVGSVSDHDCGTIDCEAFQANASDKASLQHGAKIFTNYCMGCHSAKYSRWERVADDLGIPHGMLMENLVYTDQKIGELMKIPMSESSAKQWFGVPPPDLTLVTRARSGSWVYTYLQNFYKVYSPP